MARSLSSGAHSRDPLAHPGYLLLHDVQLDLCDASSNYSQRISRRIGDIDNASGNVRTAVVDPNRHRPPGCDVCHTQLCAERQRRMSGGQFVRIEFFAARGLCSLGVEACNSLRGRRGPSCIVVSRERGMLSKRRHTPVRRKGCRSVAFQRRLPAAADKSGIFADDRGLGTGRKRRRPESDGNQLNDVAGTRRRVPGRFRIMICFNREVRSPGTADGRHLVSPPPTQTESDKQQGMIQSGRYRGRGDQAPHQPRISIFSVIIAPQPAGRARRMGGANGSRECAPDDRLRDTHQSLFAKMMGFEGLNPSYLLRTYSRDLVDRHLVRDAAQRHASERWL